jgi:hypothetical protein
MKRGLILATIVALVALLATGCTGALSMPTPTSPTLAPSEAAAMTSATTEEGVNFRLLISDENNDIGDFDELWVTITSVGVVQDGEEDELIEPFLLDPSAEVDLTKLTEENATEIWSGELEDGEYTKVFLYVDVEDISWVPDEAVTEEIVEVKLPSEKLQISKPFTISSDNDDQVVNFVFDITVIKTGKNGKYILKPQLAQSGPDCPFNDVTPQLNTEKHQEKHQEEHGKPEEQSELNLAIVEEEIAPGDTVTLLVTFEDEQPVSGAKVEVNGEKLDDPIEGLEIEVKKGNLEGELEIEFQEQEE